MYVTWDTASLTGGGVIVVTGAFVVGPDCPPPPDAVTVYWCELPGASPWSVQDVWLAGTVPACFPSRKMKYWLGLAPPVDAVQETSTEVAVVEAT